MQTYSHTFIGRAAPPTATHTSISIDGLGPESREEWLAAARAGEENGDVAVDGPGENEDRGRNDYRGEADEEAGDVEPGEADE